MPNNNNPDNNTAQLAPSASIEMIGPEQATELLKHNKFNRKLNLRRETRYGQMMSSGNWVFTGESVILNGEEILDGGHRLRAIAQAGVTIPLVVVRNVETQAFKYIDSGASRNLADSLYIEGRPHFRLTASAVNFLAGFLKYVRWTTNGVEIPERWKVIEEYSELEDIVPLYAPHIEHLPGVNRGVLIAAHALFQRADADLAVDFSDALLGNGDLESGHPVSAFHLWFKSQITKDALPRNFVAKTGNGLIRAWNALCDGEKLDKLRPPTTAPEIKAPRLASV